MEEGQQEDRLAEELLRRLDKDGELRTMAQGFAAVLKFRAGRWLLERFGVDSSQLASLIGEAQSLPDQMARHMLLFAPLGWAPSGLEPHAVYVHAADVYGRTQESDKAEEVLVNGWNESESLRVFLNRIYGLAHEYEPLRKVFARRGELIDKALEHHSAGRYEASVPIVLAQVDGIVLDLTGKEFFDYAHTAHLRDDTTIAGVPEGLEVVAAVLSRPVTKTAATGELRRHGVLHGRELGYDTLKNSTKAFVALLAVLEWARPRADALAAESRRKHEERYAGSKKRDSDARWLDRRGFEAAKDALEAVEQLQAHFHEENGQYASRIELLPKELREVLLPKESPSVQIAVGDTTDEYWATVETISGLYLGVAAARGERLTSFYAEEHPPAGGPSTDLTWTESLPDWDWEKEP